MITIKRGDTFLYSATVLGDGVVIPGGIGAWVIRSQIRTAGGTLLDELTCTITDAAACTYSLSESTAGITAGWPVDQLKMDIQYTINGVVLSTETITVDVLKDETLPVTP